MKSNFLVVGQGKSAQTASFPCLLGLFILFAAMGSLYGCGNDNPKNDAVALKVKIHQLEERLNALENAAGPQADLQKQVSELQQRVTQLDAAIKSAKVDAPVAQQPEDPGKKEAAAKPEPPAPVKKEQPAAETKTQKRYYTVESGDTLYGIARKNNLTVEELVRLNDIKKNQVIRPGQKLMVGSGG